MVSVSISFTSCILALFVILPRFSFLDICSLETSS